MPRLPLPPASAAAAAGAVVPVWLGEAPTSRAAPQNDAFPTWGGPGPAPRPARGFFGGGNQPREEGQEHAGCPPPPALVFLTPGLGVLPPWLCSYLLEALPAGPGPGHGFHWDFSNGAAPSPGQKKKTQHFGVFTWRPIRHVSSAPGGFCSLAVSAGLSKRAFFPQAPCLTACRSVRCSPKSHRGRNQPLSPLLLSPKPPPASATGTRCVVPEPRFRDKPPPFFMKTPPGFHASRPRSREGRGCAALARLLGAPTAEGEELEAALRGRTAASGAPRMLPGCSRP